MLEQKKSRAPKAALIDTLGGLVVRYQDATQRYDEAVGEVYGLGPAERLCLGFLWDGPKSASAIARHTRLTPAAVTALIDRLEKRGFVSRRPDPDDRRKVMVEAAAETLKVIADAYAPLQVAGEKSLAKYTEAELRLFARILEDSLTIQEEMTETFLARHGKNERG
jgi:DNA-binding MarR family transcriptional regulator